MGIVANAYRWIIFKTGDIRWLGWRAFPFVITWDPKSPEIKGDEVAEAIKIAQPGDVLVVRHDGYLSNRGIGGAMVHAALCVGGDYVVEAVSDDEGGVRRAHLIDVLQSDKAVLLRPKYLSKEQLLDALLDIHAIVGCKYDVYFQFNSEEERLLFKADPEGSKKKAKFCCTEIPHFTYIEHVDKLQIYRETNPKFLAKVLRFFGLPVGEKLITADMYIEAEFEVVWASKGCTVNWFERMGASEKLVNRMGSYWLSKTGVV
jgi:hypothetical protein